MHLTADTISIVFSALNWHLKSEEIIEVELELAPSVKTLKILGITEIELHINTNEVENLEADPTLIDFRKFPHLKTLTIPNMPDSDFDLSHRHLDEILIRRNHADRRSSLTVNCKILRSIVPVRIGKGSKINILSVPSVIK